MGVESLADWWTRPAGQTQLDQIQLVDQIQLETSNPLEREQSSRPEHTGLDAAQTSQSVRLFRSAEERYWAEQKGPARVLLIFAEERARQFSA
jgi:hypothetical protein